MSTDMGGCEEGVVMGDTPETKLLFFYFFVFIIRRLFPPFPPFPANSPAFGSKDSGLLFLDI